MRRALLLIALLALLVLSGYGFWTRHLAQQSIWHAPGPERFLIYLAIACAWFGAWILIRPLWLLPSTLTLVILYTAGAVGPIPVLAVAFFLCAAFVLGRLIFPRSAPELLCLLAGICAILWLFNLLAHLPVNYPATWLAILAVPLLLRPAAARDFLRAMWRPIKLDSRREYCALALALIPLLAHWLIVLKPEVSADALSMHLVVPAYVAQHHDWSFDFRHAVWAVMPMGAVWCYTVTYLLGGEFAARLLNFALLTILCVLLYTGARRWASRSAALLLVGLFASTPVVQLVTGSLFVEPLYALLVLGALTAVWHYDDTADQAFLPLTALFLASALGVKLVALPFVLPIAAMLCRRAEKRWLALSALVIAALAPQPYLYSWLKTGNPAFPYVNSIFRSPYFAPVMSPDPRFLEPLTARTPFDLTFETHRYWEGQDGSAGFHYLLLAPLLLLLIRRDWRFTEWSLLITAVGGTLLGLLLRPNIRYLYPAFPLLTLSLALLFAGKAPFRRIVWAAALACFVMNLWFLPSSSFYHKEFCLNPLERNAAERYLAEAAPVRLLVAKLNRDRPGESTLFLETMDVAGLQAARWSNGWHYWEFMNRVDALNTPIDVFRFLRQLGIRHFIFPVPDGGIPVRDYQFRFLLAHFVRAEQDIGGFRLASLPPGLTGPDAVQRAEAELRADPPAPPGRYDDFDLRIRYFAHWSHDTQFASASHQSLTYSDVPNASFHFAFHGSSITWIYTKALNRGMAEVFIDGQSSGEVDLYSPETIWQSSTSFRAPNDGDHILEIKLLARKNPQSSGAYIDVDELVVR
jgi:hypothetical protein